MIPVSPFLTRPSATWIIRREQRLPISVEEAWDYFSAPSNLNNITPDYMRFQVTSEAPESLGRTYAGQIITYKVRPILGIPLNWMTEIKHVREHEYFVDEQRFGPYRLWHHQHLFKAIPGGVEMVDLVHYKLPFGFLGNLAHGLFVRRQLEDIFDFRYRTLEERFGKL
jgi:ligand-binding SRPBCC domain-containing protein